MFVVVHHLVVRAFSQMCAIYNIERLFYAGSIESYRGDKAMAFDIV